MPEAPATYLGLACAALLMAGFVPGVSDAASGHSEPVVSRVAVKGDLLMPHQPSAHAEVVSSRVEGNVANASVLMQSRMGAVVYHSDAAAGVTMAAKNVVLPPLPERMAAKPSSSVASAVSPAPNVRGKLPVGCERVVSVLVKSAERDRIGSCLS